MNDDGRWVRLMPALFVLIWSTGFVVARLAMPHAPPLTFLGLRFALSVAVFASWIAMTRPAWPRGRAQWLHHAIAGVLMHGGYLGGVWAAVKDGLGAATVALIVGLQPLLTALWVSGPGAASAPAGSSHQIDARQWLGLGFGLLGLALVVWERLFAGQASVLNVALAVLALLSITAGTLYQKRFVAPCDVRSASLVQLAAAGLVTAPLTLLESEALVWHPDLLVALAWSVLALTLGGSSLLYLLIQRGAATRVTSLLYLVPPCTAVMAWLLFREPITTAMVAGMALTALGVGLVLRQPAGTTRLSSGQLR